MKERTPVAIFAGAHHEVAARLRAEVVRPWAVTHRLPTTVAAVVSLAAGRTVGPGCVEAHQALPAQAVGREASADRARGKRPRVWG